LRKIAVSARTAVRGQTGATGASGPQGPAGANAATHVVVRTAQGAIPAGTTGAPGCGSATASCNPGERATGGGASIAGVHAQLTDSSPASINPPTSWFGQGKDTDSTTDNVNVYVLCASP
jgi:hypothetical protein